MKKLISFVTLFAALAVFTGCTDMDKPSPLDTRAGQNQMGNGLGGIPTERFGDDTINGSPSERDSSTEGLIAGYDDLDNPNPEDVISTIYFGFDQYAVAQAERAKVAKAATELKGNETLKIVLVAHTDWYGTEEYNIALSDKRGAAVMSYLTDLGIHNTRTEIVARGKNGATPNVAKNSPEAKHDRRVDILRVR